MSLILIFKIHFFNLKPSNDLSKPIFIPPICNFVSQTYIFVPEINYFKIYYYITKLSKLALN